MEFRITINIETFGRDDGTIEQVLEGFTEAHPETGPVVAANLQTETLQITFAVDADDLVELANTASDVVADGWLATGLGYPVITVESVESVDAAAELERQLQPA